MAPFDRVAMLMVAIFIAAPVFGVAGVAVATTNSAAEQAGLPLSGD